MRTNLSCCLGLIDNGLHKSTNRLPVLVPHEISHGLWDCYKLPVISGAVVWAASLVYLLYLDYQTCPMINHWSSQRTVAQIPMLRSLSVMTSTETMLSKHYRFHESYRPRFCSGCCIQGTIGASQDSAVKKPLAGVSTVTETQLTGRYGRAL